MGREKVCMQALFMSTVKSSVNENILLKEKNYIIERERERERKLMLFINLNK